mgnify:CR=1 FL=1
MGARKPPSKHTWGSFPCRATAHIESLRHSTQSCTCSRLSRTCRDAETQVKPERTSADGGVVTRVTTRQTLRQPNITPKHHCVPRDSAGVIALVLCPPNIYIPPHQLLATASVWVVFVWHRLAEVTRRQPHFVFIACAQIAAAIDGATEAPVLLEPSALPLVVKRQLVAGLDVVLGDECHDLLAFHFPASHQHQAQYSIDVGVEATAGGRWEGVSKHHTHTAAVTNQGSVRQLGSQLWFMNRAMPPFNPASMYSPPFNVIK